MKQRLIFWVLFAVLLNQLAKASDENANMTNEDSSIIAEKNLDSLNMASSSEPGYEKQKRDRQW